MIFPAINPIYKGFSMVVMPVMPPLTLEKHTRFARVQRGRGGPKSSRKPTIQYIRLLQSRAISAHQKKADLPLVGNIWLIYG